MILWINNKLNKQVYIFNSKPQILPVCQSLVYLRETFLLSVKFLSGLHPHVQQMKFIWNNLHPMYLRGIIWALVMGQVWL